MRLIKIRPDSLEVKAEALEDCAIHLELNWTDEKSERIEGLKLSRQFRRQATRLRQRATDIRRDYVT